MFIYGITQNNFKDIQYAIKLLAQFNIVSIKRQCIICITITRYFIFSQSCPQRRLFRILCSSSVKYFSKTFANIQKIPNFAK